MNRKNFLQKACLTGLCACGFSRMTKAADNATSPEQDNNKQLKQDWLSNLLSNLKHDLNENVVRDLVKKSSITHYNNLNMEALLANYIGNLEKFNAFIESSWGWKIDYNKTTNVLIADENKNFCVCPIIEHKKGMDTSAICYCSEGFAEKMFSTVTGVRVTARVISSVRKGDKSCKYKIEISR